MMYGINVLIGLSRNCLGIGNFMIPWHMFLASVVLVSCGKQEGCHVLKSASAASSDGKWSAISHSDVCGGGMGNGYVSDFIDLQSEAAEVHTVLIPEGQWPTSDLPLLKWINGRTLEVVVPNRSLFPLREENYQGVTIQVRYEHDDPPDRDKWLAWRKQNIAWVDGHSQGPQPQPPAIPRSQ
jgi:hypothetical protein